MTLAAKTDCKHSILTGSTCAECGVFVGLPKVDVLGAVIQGFWLDLQEKDDRTSPEEYPDMCLITRDELAAMLKYAAALPTT